MAKLLFDLSANSQRPNGIQPKVTPSAVPSDEHKWNDMFEEIEKISADHKIYQHIAGADHSQGLTPNLPFGYVSCTNSRIETDCTLVSRKDDRIIAVMGTTGVGKTHFISFLAPEAKVDLHHGLTRKQGKRDVHGICAQF